MAGNSEYQLLDSGDGLKIERFGQRTLVRPSSLCIWGPRAGKSVWESADARFEPKQGWNFKRDKFDEWDCRVENFTLRLRTQDNGQVGFFPEHTSYLPELLSAINAAKSRRGSAPSVLNLFAYTGMASIAAAKAGAHVTHVDLSKKALDWANANFELNGVTAESRRIIREDAGDFVDREVRRQKHYDIILTDPPSFSRISSSKTWQLDEVLAPMVGSLSKLLYEDGGSVFFTSHHAELGGIVVGNLLCDALPMKNLNLQYQSLSIAEKNSPRIIPAGSLVHASF